MELLTSNQVIELLGINLNNLRQLQHRKTIYWVKKEGRKVFYDAEQVNAYKIKRENRIARRADRCSYSTI